MGLSTDSRPTNICINVTYHTISRLQHLRGLRNKTLLYCSTSMRYNYFATDQFPYSIAAILQYFSVAIL